ncbi:DUF885 domain-containing protein [Massilia yuzhufengensis]|uniref:Uncharacterized conserved protein, DUF885 familyt n=1 Tax=Massilia yuzhufengensis TaxID=1164594 RepID=A0A1I1DGZ7_9BURK|nr:DUF885 domain-containing protein [Massilia yuzhufengensis]SFB73686.1 Uncharacterized conserved protein, DUF885 familyt [Massilia yuzhufengensis]
MRTFFASIFLLVPLACGAADTAAETARRLFEREWQWQLRQQPEYATGIGEHRHDALLTDTSLAARSAAAEHARQVLNEARQLDRAQLDGKSLVSYELFVAAREQALAAAAFTAFDPQPLSAWDGLHLRLPRLVAQMPFTTEQDYRNYLWRLDALPVHVDGLVEQLRAGMRAGWSVPKVAMAPVPDALRQLRETIADGPLNAPFQRIPASIDASAREDLVSDSISALADAAAALDMLETFLRLEYLPSARETIGASALPGGAAWYAFLVRSATTTALTPAEVHALGLKEVARIRAEIDTVIPRTGFRGGFDKFIVFARSDQRLFFTQPEALLARYRKALARAQARLPKVVATIADAGIAVKPMNQDGAGQPVAYYEAGSKDRSAALVVNTAQLASRPVWQVDSVALHEGVPGHHLQVARAQLLDLPAFRRHAWYEAFGEGWATYAESLGPALGFFDDPFTRFGHLNEEMLRAARLVVDTGIHGMGWSRKQAIDYLNAHTANPLADNEAEVDRYIARPAQALAYKIGQLRIKALRERARQALGERFDLRRFHDAVLKGGALPLDQLQQQVERWILNEKEAGKPAAPAPPAPPAAAPKSLPKPE